MQQRYRVRPRRSHQGSAGATEQATRAAPGGGEEGEGGEGWEGGAPAAAACLPSCAARTTPAPPTKTNRNMYSNGVHGNGLI